MASVPATHPSSGTMSTAVHARTRPSTVTLQRERGDDSLPNDGPSGGTVVFVLSTDVTVRDPLDQATRLTIVSSALRVFVP